MYMHVPALYPDGMTLGAAPCGFDGDCGGLSMVTAPRLVKLVRIKLKDSKHSTYDYM